MPTRADQHKTAHQDLHSERGAETGDRTDRARNPVIKVEDLALPGWNSKSPTWTAPSGSPTTSG